MSEQLKSTRLRRVLRACAALTALLASQQAYAQVCVNGGAPAPLEICVHPTGTIGVWVQQPNGRAHQYFNATAPANGTLVSFGPEGQRQRFQTDYLLNRGHEDSATPVSNQLSGTGTSADPYQITTVFAHVASGLRLTQQVGYVNGDRHISKTWTLENTGSQTHQDLQLFHGGDTYFAGDDSARGWYDADLRMVYLTNRSMNNAGYMAFYANPMTPFSHYYAGHYSYGRSELRSGSLSDHASREYQDAGYYLEWQRPVLRPGETWRIEAFETWSPPGVIQVLSAGDEYTLAGRTIRKVFKIQNLNDTTSQAVTWAVNNSSSWTVQSPGPTSATIAPLGIVEVPVEIVVPAGAPPGSAAEIQLDVQGASIAPASGSTRFIVAELDYTLSTRQLDFGRDVVEDENAELTVTFTNGAEPLSLGHAGAANPLVAPFHITEDNCSGASLAAAADCSITVRFSPRAGAEYNDSFGLPVIGPIVMVDETVAVTGTSIGKIEVSASSGAGGTISPATIRVAPGRSTSFTVAADEGHRVLSVSGCAGSLSGGLYTTGAITAPCSVQAQFERIPYTVNAVAASGGSVVSSGTPVLHGDTATFTINPSQGYLIGTLSGCPGTLSGNLFTTAPITASCTLQVGFDALVNANAGAGGTISPATSRVVPGSSTTFAVSADEGYRVVSVSGCAGSVSGGLYTTGAITTPCSVQAQFERIPYVVNAGRTSGGSVVPASASVLHGQTRTFQVTPAQGYQIGSVGGCPGTLSGNTFTTAPITAACTLQVTFDVKMTSVAVEGGSKGGGGSTSLFGVAGLLLLIARRLRRAAVLSATGMAVASGAQAAAGPGVGLHAGVLVAAGTSSESASAMTRALQNQGYPVSVDLNDRRAIWRIHGGWTINPALALEIGYSNLGEVTATYQGTVPELAIEGLLAAAAQAQPRKARGFDLSLASRYTLPFAKRVSLNARAGVFRWDAERRVATDERELVQYTDGANLLVGAGLGFALTARLEFTAEWIRHGMGGESVNSGGAGLRYRW